jgi:hypothetical protein
VLHHGVEIARQQMLDHAGHERLVISRHGANDTCSWVLTQPD